MNVCGYMAFKYCTKSDINLKDFRGLVLKDNDFTTEDILHVARETN